MIHFLKHDKNLIIALVVNVILLEFMHIFKVHYVLSECIALFISYLLKKKISKKFFVSYFITLFAEITITNIIMRFAFPYFVINLSVSIFVLITMFALDHNNEFVNKILGIYGKVNQIWEKFLNLKFIRAIFIALPKNLIVFLLFLLSIITVFKYCKDYVTNTGVIYFNEPKDVSVQIKEKTKLDLSFINSNKKFDDICLKISADESNTKITLSSKNINETLDSSKINKYGYLCFNAKGISLDNLKKEDVHLSSNKVINLYKSKDNEIAVQLSRNQRKDIMIIDISVSIIIIVLFLTINYLINAKKISEDKMYLVFSLFFVLLMFVFPPFQVPDEVAHFNRAYNYSQPEIKDNFSFGKEDIEVPENIDCVDYANIHKSNKVYKVSEIESCLKDTKNKVVKNTERTGSQILGYITQTLGIKLADIFTNSPLIIFFSGRFLTLIVSILITYLAIKITPKYKTIFLTVSTMMMLLQQMISYSYDSILNSVCLLFVAYILKFIYESKNISIKNLIVPTLILVMIANIKMVYLPLALLLLMIPKEKFHNKKKKILFMFVMVLVAILLSKFVDSMFAVAGSGDTGALKQLKYLMNTPLDIIKIAINTIGEKGLFYIESLVGYFGWFMIKLSPIYIYVYIFLYIYLINGEDSKLERKYLIIISVIFMIIAIFGAMYIVWSDYKLPYVEGVQGRYLFPLIIPTCLLFIPKKKKYKIDNKIVYSIINVLLFQYLFVILFTFY